MRVLLHRVSLFFAARIGEACRRAHAELVATVPGATLLAEVERVRPDLVLVELERADLEELRALRNRPELSAVRVVGFGAHVNEELFAAARAAGVDEALAKGAFSGRLEALLGEP